MRFVWLGLVLILAACSKVDNTKAIENGGYTYDENCAACHDRPPAYLHTVPPSLKGLFASKKLTPQQVRQIISEGINTMPSFGTTIKGKDLDELMLFLETQ